VDYVIASMASMLSGTPSQQWRWWLIARRKSERYNKPAVNIILFLNIRPLEISSKL
jgi:hypothetical protein